MANTVDISKIGVGHGYAAYQPQPQPHPLHQKIKEFVETRDLNEALELVARDEWIILSAGRDRGENAADAEHGGILWLLARLR